MSQNPGEGTKKPKHRFMKFAGILIFLNFQNIYIIIHQFFSGCQLMKSKKALNFKLIVIYVNMWAFTFLFFFVL